MRHQIRHRSRRVLVEERLAVSSKHPALHRPVRRLVAVLSRSQARASQQALHVSGSTPTQPGRFGEVMDATDEQGQPASPAEQRRQEHEWGIAAEQALRSAKVCGHDPLGVERPLAESRQSQQDWRAILRDFVAATAPSDYRWTPPNRRYVASGLYLPSVERRGLGEIVIAVDTSGSIGKFELEQFAGEIIGNFRRGAAGRHPRGLLRRSSSIHARSSQHQNRCDLSPKAVAVRTSAQCSNGSTRTGLSQSALST